MKKFSKAHHENWPTSVFYLPVFLYYIASSIRLRSFNYFTWVNPALKAGGLCGFSKYKSYSLLEPDFVPKTLLMKAGCLKTIEALEASLKEAQIGFPLILKPDQGERGFLVKKVKSLQALYMDLQTYGKQLDFLIQELIEGPLELGVFVIKKPQTGWEISSITSKNFFTIVGDGQKSIQELASENERGSLYFNLEDSEFSEKAVLPLGQELVLEPIGNHCRGTEFVNENTRISKRLEEKFAEVLKNTKGLSYSRLDIRTSSWEALEEGDFKVLEINGVSAEPAHIYDAGVSTKQAYQDLFYHWSSMTEIAKQSRPQTQKRERFVETLKIVSEHLKKKKKLSGEMQKVNSKVNSLSKLQEYFSKEPDFYKKDANVILDQVSQKLDIWDESLYLTRDPNKAYCRVSLFKNEDCEVVLCRWKKGHNSGMHKHPEQGCWFRCLTGKITEKRQVSQDVSCILEGQTGYIEDSLGGHEMCNKVDPVAISLHFYRNHS